MTLSVNDAERTVGVVTTAISAVPPFRAAIACSYMYARVAHPVFFKHGQKQAAQRHLACRNIYAARAQRAAVGNFRLAHFYMLIRYFNMLIKPFAFGGQLHSLIAAGKERAAKLCFKVFNCSG